MSPIPTKREAGGVRDIEPTDPVFETILKVRGEVDLLVRFNGQALPNRREFGVNDTALTFP